MPANLNMNEWKMHILGSPKKFAMPIMTHPGIHLIGRTVFEAVTVGEVHALAIEALAGKYPAVASTMLMDLTVEAEAFGASVVFKDSEIPSITGRLVYDEDSVISLAVPSLSAARVPEFLKASRMAAERITDRPVLGGCIGPFSLAARLFGMTELMTEICLFPDIMDCLLEKCSAFLADYCRELKKCGMNGLIMAEPAAGLLEESMCDRFSSRHIARIVAQEQDENFLFILHNCGNTGHVTKSMIRTGASGLHFGNHLDMVTALREIPGDILVFGNVDPAMLRISRADDVYQAVRHLLQKTQEFPNFVLSTGCDTPPGVPDDIIGAFYAAVHDFNKQPATCDGF